MLRDLVNNNQGAGEHREDSTIVMFLLGNALNNTGRNLNGTQIAKVMTFSTLLLDYYFDCIIIECT